MKQLIAIVASVLVTSAAQAQSSYEILTPKRTLQTATITKVIGITQPAYFPEIGTAGMIQIDKALKTVNLTLSAPDSGDATFFKPIAQLQLKLVGTVRDTNCITTTYTAVTDPTSFSRVTDKLTIVDNSHNICESFRQLAPTEIRLERTVNGIVLGLHTVDMNASALTREVVE